jgi:glycosyltransferase involved in cell wall biosynthesis
MTDMNENNKTISVIVPIFNVETYLHKCIDSILMQSYHNLEIILVNDGSPDNCGKICDEYATKDERIKIIHKKNGGLSDARNAGIRIATGDYVSFVDSDDWLDANTYELIMNKVTQNDADIGEFNINFVYDNEIRLKSINTDKEIYNTEDAMKELIHAKTFQTTVWNKIYRRDCIAGIEFPFGKTNEDEFWTYQIFSRAEKIVFLNKALYFYRQRSTSIMGNYSLKRLDGVEGMYNRMCFIKNQFPGLYLNSKIILLKACIFHYQIVIRFLKKDEGRKGKKLLCKYRKKIKFSFNEIALMNLKDKAFVILSSISMELFCRIRNTYKNKRAIERI